MSRKPIEIGDNTFKSKTDAKTFYSDILNRYDIGEKLSGEDFDDVAALLLQHPNCTIKIGCGIKQIKVDKTRYAANKCFHIIRTDDSVEDFSIAKCIDGNNSDIQKFRSACRSVVYDDLRNFKIDYFHKNAIDGKVKCDKSGTRIGFEESHVDHREPLTFSAIVHFYVQAKNINYSNISYKDTQTYGPEFNDEELIKDFKSWHNHNAKIRIISKKTNLGKGHLGRIKPTKADKSLI